MKNVSNIENYSDDISNAELVKKSQFGDKPAFEQLVAVSYTHLTLPTTIEV